MMRLALCVERSMEPSGSTMTFCGLTPIRAFKAVEARSATGSSGSGLLWDFSIVTS